MSGSLAYIVPIGGHPSHGPIEPPPPSGYPTPGPVPPSGPVDPGFGIPLPPVTVWPTPPVVGGGPVIPPTYPVDPGYGQGYPRPPGYVSGGPVPPGYASGQPLPPGYASGQPLPPGYASGQPVLPGGPTDPGYGQGHPRPPHVGGGPAVPPNVVGWPRPPVNVWPPLQPVYPDLPIYLPPGHASGQPVPPTGSPPDQSIEAPPGVVWPPLPGIEGKVLALVWIIGYGYRWTVIDPSLTIGGGPSGPPASVDGDPALTPEPKTT